MGRSGGRGLLAAAAALTAALALGSGAAQSAVAHQAVVPTNRPAPAATAPGQMPIAFATYNICKIECRTGRFSWPNRRESVARNIVAAGADVVAVQEADRGDDHWLDLAGLLRPAGYTIASRNLSACSGACGDHLFYRSAAVERVALPVAAGLVSLEGLSHTAPWGQVKDDRSFSWAFLRHKASGAVFLAISIHLPNEKTRSAERVRVAAARGVAAWADRETARMGLAGIPIVVLGDLNSYAPRQPVGAQKQLTDAGYVDSYTATKRINQQYSTVNTTRATARYGGWPPKPPTFGPHGNRLDYIMAKGAGTPLSWEISLTLRNGRFDNRYRGSDHNLVRATIGIPTP